MEKMHKNHLLMETAIDLWVETKLVSIDYGRFPLLT